MAANMDTDMTTQFSLEAPDPAIAKIIAQKYWNHFAIQLGHWNPMKVIIMDDDLFRQIHISVKIELAREMR